MPKDKLTLSARDGLKDELETIGQWYLENGVDVQDKRRGGISISATIERLAEEKLAAMKKRGQRKE